MPRVIISIKLKVIRGNSWQKFLATNVLDNPPATQTIEFRNNLRNSH